MKKNEIEKYAKATEKTLDYSVSINETTKCKLELIAQFMDSYRDKLSGYNCASNPIVITAFDSYYKTISFVIPVTEDEKSVLVNEVLKLYPKAV